MRVVIPVILMCWAQPDLLNIMSHQVFLNVMVSSNRGNWAKFQNSDYDQIIAAAMMEKNIKIVIDFIIEQKKCC